MFKNVITFVFRDMSHECCEGSNKRVYCAFPGITVKEALDVLFNLSY